MPNRDGLDLPRPFGSYTLLRRLAVGGMAEVYVAKAKGIGGFEKSVALKLIHPRFSEDDHFVQMLVEEAKLSVLLTHHNIAQTFDLGCIEDSYFIVMELIEGADAFRVLRRAYDRRARLPLDLCTFIVAEMCQGLDYAHKKKDIAGVDLNIVHRDISPQNVLISFSGEVKIVDFGIAKAAQRTSDTGVGVIKGKYSYMSPEQAWADPVDHRSDVFSTGIVLYELLTGEMLYQEESLPLLLDEVRRAEIPAPSTKRRDIPSALDEIVMKALAREPEDRYQSALEFGQALTTFLHQTLPTFTPTRLAQLMSTLFPDEEARAAEHTGPQARPANVEEPSQREVPTKPPPSKGVKRRGPTRPMRKASLGQIPDASFDDEPDTLTPDEDFTSGDALPAMRPEEFAPAFEQSVIFDFRQDELAGLIQDAAREAEETTSSQRRPEASAPVTDRPQVALDLSDDDDDLTEVSQDWQKQAAAVAAMQAKMAAVNEAAARPRRPRAVTGDAPPGDFVWDEATITDASGDILAKIREALEKRLAAERIDDGSKPIELAPEMTPDPRNMPTAARGHAVVRRAFTGEDSDIATRPSLAEQLESEEELATGNLSFDEDVDDEDVDATQRRSPELEQALSPGGLLRAPATEQQAAVRFDTSPPASVPSTTPPPALHPAARGGTVPSPVVPQPSAAPSKPPPPLAAPLSKPPPPLVPDAWRPEGDDGETEVRPSPSFDHDPFAPVGRSEPPPREPTLTRTNADPFSTDDLTNIVQEQRSGKGRRAMFGILLGVFVVGGGIAALLSMDSEPPPPPVRVEVHSVPGGAMVSLGGQEVGRTPITLTEEDGLERGELARVAVVLEGYETWETNVRPEGSTQRLVAALRRPRRDIDIETTPADASVFIDQSFQGRTPARIEGLSVGRTYRLQITHEGFQPIEEELDLERIEGTRLRFELRPL